METIKVRGLAFLSACILGAWGACVAAKGFYDLFGGEPEANLYSLAPWLFLSRDEWSRYAGFELTYGFSCLALAVLLRRFSRFLPETFQRPRRASESGLFR